MSAGASRSRGVGDVGAAAPVVTVMGAEHSAQGSSGSVACATLGRLPSPSMSSRGGRRGPVRSPVRFSRGVGSLTHLRGFASRDMAVDLGTTSTVVCVRGRGIVLSEPSLVALEGRTGKARAVGIEAKNLLDGGARSITVVRPLTDGVISDIELAAEMLRRFFRKVWRSRRAQARVVVLGVPSGATGVEKRAAEEACLSAGARHACLIEEPLAAAVGAGVPIAELAAGLVVDIGGGTTEVAVISLGEIVVSQSIRVGGDELDEAIVKHLRREHKLLIAQHTAEEVKRQIGSAFPMGSELRVELRGRDISGSPATAVVSSEEIRGALERPVVQIIDAVKNALDRIPPQLYGDIVDRGMILTGGGSLLRGLHERLRQETELPAQLAELPLTCVAAGAAAWLEEPEPINSPGEASRIRAQR
jgi:rod shape-determining protein MreB and related proteins